MPYGGRVFVWLLLFVVAGPGNDSSAAVLPQIVDSFSVCDGLGDKIVSFTANTQLRYAFYQCGTDEARFSDLPTGVFYSRIFPPQKLFFQINTSES
jgi:hypothetical protein